MENKAEVRERADQIVPVIEENGDVIMPGDFKAMITAVLKNGQLNLSVYRYFCFIRRKVEV